MPITQDKKDIDINGYVTYYDVPMTKAGVFPYLGKTISSELEPDKVYNVLRPIEELTRPETLRSLESIPFVIDHTMIGEGFTPPEDKGIEGTTLKNVKVKGDLISNDLTAYTDRCKRAIENGKRDLSMGYRCRYELTPGEYQGQHYDAVQRDIIFNHIALVDEGRMGAECRIYDNAIVYDNAIFCDNGTVIVYDRMDVYDDWFTVHPNGKEHKGRHIFAEEGESKADAIARKFPKKEQKKQNVINTQKTYLDKYKENSILSGKGENGEKEYNLSDTNFTDEYLKKHKKNAQLWDSKTRTMINNPYYNAEKAFKKQEQKEQIKEAIRNFKPSAAQRAELKAIEENQSEYYLKRIRGYNPGKYDSLDIKDLHNKEKKHMATFTIDEDLKEEIKEEIKKELLDGGAVIEEKKEDISDAAPEAPAEDAPACDADEDKRKLIDEIGGILKGKVDDELIRTIMKKAEELAYKPSETGVNDACGTKDAEETMIKEEKKEEEKKPEGLSMDEAVKYFAKRDNLVNRLKSVIGDNANYNQMTVEQVVKYGCDKLDIPVSLRGLEGYLTAFGKHKKTYVTIAKDSAEKISNTAAFLKTYKSKN